MKLSKPKCDFAPVETLLMEAVASHALVESVRMKLYDKLDTPKTLSEIAAAMEVAEKGMEVFLNSLEARDLLVKSGDFYSNSPLASEFLVSSSPFYQGGLLQIREGFVKLVNEEMASLLREPGSVQERIYQKMLPSDYLKGVAQHAMRGSLQDLVDFIAAQDNFSEMRALCDIGGNHGRYSMALLDRNPKLTAEILDLPKVTPFSKEAVHEAGYEKRIAVKDFDLRTDKLKPQAYDLVLISHVLQAFADSLESVIAKIGASVKRGGLFASQNMNPATGSNRKLKTSTALVSCLLAEANHYLPQDDLANALTNAGFVEIKMQVGGPGEANLMVVARKG